MYALIETVGKHTNIWIKEDNQAIETFMIQWYNENVKAAIRINWDYTMIDLKSRYARIYDGIEIRELRVGVVG